MTMTTSQPPSPPFNYKAVFGDAKYNAAKIIIKFLGKIGYRPTLKGLENVNNLDPYRGVILASNHHSTFDAYIMGIFIKKKIHFLGRSSTLWNSRVSAWFNNFFGTIPVYDKKDKNAASIRAGIKVLKQGKALGIFPEAEIRPERKKFEGKTGVAVLALRANVPIVPVGIIGSMGQVPWGGYWPPAGKKVYVTYGKPIFVDEYVEEYGIRDQGQTIDPALLREITNQVMREIRKLSKGYGVPLSIIPKLKEIGAWY